MNNLFNFDSGVMGVLSKLVDIVIASVLWLIFSLPVITIGASTTALYYTCVKVIRRGRSYVWQSFWKSFKENFGEATILWLFILIFSSVLGLNIRFTLQMTGTLGQILRGVYLLMEVLLLIAVIYIFPILSRFSMDKRAIMKMAFLLSIKHLPFTVIMAVIVIGMGVLNYIIPILIFVSPAITVLLCSLLMERILKLYIESSEDRTIDEWYLE